MKNFLLMSFGTRGIFRPLESDFPICLNGDEAERFEKWRETSDIGDVIELSENRLIMRVGSVTQ